MRRPAARRALSRHRHDETYRLNAEVTILLFGIYPGSVAGDDQGELANGPADDHAAISQPGGGRQRAPPPPRGPRRPVEIDDLFRFRFVTAADLSPDGGQV